MMRLRTLFWIVPSLLLAAVQAPTETIERVVVKVNGEILTLSEFNALQVAAVQQAELSSDAEVEDYLRRNNARILEDAVEELLLVQRAAEIGIALQPAYVDSIVNDIKKENGIQSDDEFAAQLRKEGMTVADLRRNIQRSVLRREVVMQELGAKTNVSDAEVIAEYDRRKAAEFTTPASVTLQEIVVSDAALARDIVSRARDGADFAELARAYSAGPTAASGGDLGSMAQQDLGPAFAAVVDVLEPGGISDPLPVPDGYQILRLVLRTEAQVQPFEQARGRISRELVNARRDAAYEEYVADLRSTAVVEYKVREVATAVDAGGVQLAPSVLDDGDAAQDPDAEFEGLEAAPGSGPERVVPEPLPGDPAPTPTPAPE